MRSPQALRSRGRRWSRTPLLGSTSRAGHLTVAVASALLLVGTAVAACSAARQRVGDIYARTVVIEESFGSSVRVAVVVLWSASLAGAGWAIPRICSVNRFAPPPYLSQVLIRVGRNESLAYLQVGSLSVNVQLVSNPLGHSALVSAESTRSQ